MLTYLPARESTFARRGEARGSTREPECLRLFFNSIPKSDSDVYLWDQAPPETFPPQNVSCEVVATSGSGRVSERLIVNHVRRPCLFQDTEPDLNTRKQLKRSHSDSFPEVSNDPSPKRVAIDVSSATVRYGPCALVGEADAAHDVRFPLPFICFPVLNFLFLRFQSTQTSWTCMDGPTVSIAARQRTRVKTLSSDR